MHWRSLGPHPLLVCALLVCGLARDASADADRPRDRNLVLAGLAMAPPTYLLGVTLHEGSHALMGKLFGAEVTEFRVWPGRDPRTGAFHFGFTRLGGKLTPRQRKWFFIAPKLTDTLLFGGYALALHLDGLPQDHYGQLAFAVLATGFWVDFGKDIFSVRAANDQVKLYKLFGLNSEWQRLPWRALHLTLTVTAAYSLYHGYQGLFDDTDHSVAARLPVILPVMSGTF